MINSDADEHRASRIESNSSSNSINQETSKTSVDQASRSAKEQEQPQKSHEEEGKQEKLVLIQFTDLDDANYCQQYSHKFQSIDIGAKNPIIQIGNRLYSAEYQNNIGTYLLFEEETAAPAGAVNSDQQAQQHQEAKNSSASQRGVGGGPSSNEDAAHSNSSSSGSSSYSYKGKTYKRLVLNRLFVEENQKPSV